MIKDRKIEISEGVYWVGIKDWKRRLFDSLIPLPQGTTYNAYLVKGDHKIALIDTVNPGFEGELEKNISGIAKIEELDYVVMNHAEPDHAGAIPYVFKKNKKAILITSKKGLKMASGYYHVPDERVKVVGDKDVLDLGNRRLRFIEAPFLHWPETIFTYLEEGGVLFPCDFFGAHTAFGFYDEDNEELLSSAKRYFGEIMMPFRSMGREALEKIKELEINIIAPSHGPIYRNPAKILEAYKKWTEGETKEKVIVLYVSMWGSTERMVHKLVEELFSGGIEVSLYNLATADIGEIAKDLVDSRALVLGTPSVRGGMHPLAIYGAYLVKILRPPLQYGAILSSYGWGGGAIRQALDILTPTKIELVGKLEINGPPKKEDYKRIKEITRELIRRIKED